MIASNSVALSIVSHGHESMVGALLADIKQLTSVRPIEVILTENIPGNLADLAEKVGVPVRLIQNRQPKGFGANHNYAFSISTAQYFVVLNPDIRLPDYDPFQPLIDRINRFPGVAGPKVISSNGAIEDSARRIPSLTRLVSRVLLQRRMPDYAVSKTAQHVDWVAGMCMLFDRASFARVGGFDERYFLYCEDVDICLRMHLVDRNVSWVSDSVVLHDAQRHSRQFRSAYFRHHLYSMIRLMTSSAYWRFRV